LIRDSAGQGDGYCHRTMTSGFICEWAARGRSDEGNQIGI
jgi:hypothetical protein